MTDPHQRPAPSGNEPATESDDELRIGENPTEILKCDLKIEVDNHKTLTEAIAHCESVRDYVTRDLLQENLEDVEEQIDWLETNLELINKVGLENYLQSQMGED